MYNTFSKNNNKPKISLFRIFILSLSFIILGFIISFYISSSKLKITSHYDTTINNFYSKFNNCEFDEAENILKSNFSSNNTDDKLTKDLTNYFTGVINKVCSSVTSSEITDYEALTVLNEIKKYNVLTSSLDTLIASLNNPSDNNESTTANTTMNDSNSLLSKGIASFKNEEYGKAISYFTSISESNTEDYKEAIEHINKCKTEYKNSLFSKADKLCSEDYYTKAIELLTSYDTNILDSENKEISKKINSIRILREEYLNTITEETSQ